LSYRHRIYPFPIGERTDKLYPVYWSIDATGWDTGWYLVAIITEDSFGNRGIAPFTKGANGSGYATNPQHWRFVTGSSGL
jgi:hypothetical protein